MKTLQEIRNQVAKKHGFGNWEDLQAEWLKRTGMTNVVHESYVDEAAKLYAQEACREQREICAKAIWPGCLDDIEQVELLTDAEISIKNAPEPTLS